MESTFWFGAKTIYKFTEDSGEGHVLNIYEERIIVLKALSLDQAIEKAETQALKYAKEFSGEYLGFVNVFQLFDEAIEENTEVYSSMRESNLNSKEYLDSFFDTGKERSKIS